MPEFNYKLFMEDSVSRNWFVDCPVNLFVCFLVLCCLAGYVGR
jgi:hypothetical protein